ncbi:WD repeat-containing protein 20 [Sciurus carolinensis]|uniref:WD repeat-containing protein 20 n=1 Tax=Sciurus carolinensis TaxID=30640 RepID=A0AA41MWJ9_SCICA|nr:WD repeat-containing protein 20 [Sciurus carolinensis]
MEFSGSDEDFQDLLHFDRDRANSTQSLLSKRTFTDWLVSVGQDTPLCLWDLMEDNLFPHQPLSRTRTHTNVMNNTCPPVESTGKCHSAREFCASSAALVQQPYPLAGLQTRNKSSVLDGAIASGVSKFATLVLHNHKERHQEKDHKRKLNISSKSSDKLNLVTKTKADPAKILGTPLCPGMEDVPLLETLICKRHMKDY